MKAVFPSKSENPTIDSELEPVFGNAKSYFIVGANMDDYVVIPNDPNSEKECHMGDLFLKYGVDTVVSCELCEHCMQNLKNLGIDTWKCDGSVNIRESYNKFILGGIFSRVLPDIVECQHTKKQQAITQ
jgi:predicted Fe-Mo cluster-binding NifX family protein